MVDVYRMEFMSNGEMRGVKVLKGDSGRQGDLLPPPSQTGEGLAGAGPLFAGLTVLICGDRDWTNREAIAEVIRSLPPGSTVIHGAARGADRIAGEVAAAHGLRVVAVPANWELHHKAAGPIRNRVMLDMQPDRVIAFHNDLEASKGTRDCVVEARRRGIETTCLMEKS